MTLRVMKKQKIFKNKMYFFLFYKLFCCNRRRRKILKVHEVYFLPALTTVKLFPENNIFYF